MKKQETKPKKETVVAAEDGNDVGGEGERKDKKDSGEEDDQEGGKNKAMADTGPGGAKPKNPVGTGEPPEPTGEKKVVKNPKPEAKENNPGATKTR